MSYFKLIGGTDSDSEETVIKTIQDNDRCICCLSKNVKFVSLLKCKHTSFFESFFKFRFQFQKTVVCVRCHHFLCKIDLFKAQIEECLALIYKGELTQPTLSKQFQNFISVTTPADKLQYPKEQPKSTVVEKYIIKPKNLVAGNVLSLQIKDINFDKDIVDIEHHVGIQGKENSDTNGKDSETDVPSDMYKITLLEFMERYGDLEVMTSNNADQLWNDLTKRFNYLGAFNWVEDDVKKKWAGWKAEVKTKALSVINQTNDDGAVLTALEERVLAVSDHSMLDVSEVKEVPAVKEEPAVKLELVVKVEPANEPPQSPKTTSSVEQPDGESETMVSENEYEGDGSKEVDQPSSMDDEFGVQRAIPEQFKMILEFMERHGDLSVFTGNLKKSRARADRLWRQLHKDLNSLPTGALKSVDKWKKVWIGWKANTKRKLASNGGTSPPSLTPIEERLLAVMKRSKRQRQQSPDSSAAEQDYSISENKDKTIQTDLKEFAAKTRSRTSYQQMHKMVDFMDRASSSAIFTTPNSIAASKLWQELANDLNTDSDNAKSVEKWKKAWADIKCYTKRKAMLRRCGWSTEKRLSKLGERVMAILVRYKPGLFKQINIADQSHSVSSIGPSDDEVMDVDTQNEYLVDSNEQMFTNPAALVTTVYDNPEEEDTFKNNTTFEAFNMVLIKSENYDTVEKDTKTSDIPEPSERLHVKQIIKVNPVYGSLKNVEKSIQRLKESSTSDVRSLRSITMKGTNITKQQANELIITPQLSVEQQIVVADFVKRHGHPDLWNDKKGPNSVQKLWVNLTKKVNSVPGADLISVHQCRKAWEAWVYRLRSTLKSKDNFADTSNALTEIDERILPYLKCVKKKRNAEHRRTATTSKSVQPVSERFIDSSHWPVPMTTNEGYYATQKTARKRCVACRNKKTTFSCESCHVPLCIHECFKTYHTAM